MGGVNMSKKRKDVRLADLAGCLARYMDLLQQPIRVSRSKAGKCDCKCIAV